MRQSGWSRMRRPSIWALVIAICAVPLSVSAMAATPARYSAALTAPASASEHGRTRISGFNDDRTTVKVGRTVVDRVVVVPRARRTVEVQARRPGSSKFVTQSRGRSTAAGAFRAVYAPTSAGTWRFRLRVLPSATRAAATSETRVLNAIDVAAPRAVSSLQVSEISLDSATLTWVNPTDKDFTGVTIRRAAGANAPASQLDGTAVKDTDRNATTFTDTGLTAGTEYSYALFAHDSSGNYSRATVVTLRTGRFGVSFLEAQVGHAQHRDPGLGQPDGRRLRRRDRPPRGRPDAAGLGDRGHGRRGTWPLGRTASPTPASPRARRTATRCSPTTGPGTLRRQ